MNQRNTISFVQVLGSKVRECITYVLGTKCLALFPQSSENKIHTNILPFLPLSHRIARRSADNKKIKQDVRRRTKPNLWAQKSLATLVRNWRKNYSTNVLIKFLTLRVNVRVSWNTNNWYLKLRFITTLTVLFSIFKEDIASFRF